MKTLITLAAAALAFAAQPAAAQDTAYAQSFFNSLVSAGKAEVFFAKTMLNDGPAEPYVRAKVTSIWLSQGCEMAIYFEAEPGVFTPYRSPMFLSWFTLKGLNHYGSYHTFVRSSGASTTWGLISDTSWNDRFTEVTKRLLNDCSRG